MQNCADRSGWRHAELRTGIEDGGGHTYRTRVLAMRMAEAEGRTDDSMRIEACRTGEY
jgi:hypothetical protein